MYHVKNNNNKTFPKATHDKVCSWLKSTYIPKFLCFADSSKPKIFTVPISSNFLLSKILWYINVVPGGRIDYWSSKTRCRWLAAEILCREAAVQKFSSFSHPKFSKELHHNDCPFQRQLRQSAQTRRSARKRVLERANATRCAFVSTAMPLGAPSDFTGEPFLRFARLQGCTVAIRPEELYFPVRQ